MGEGYEVANPPGLALEVINAAAHSLGIEVNYVRLPNKRVLQELKSGNLDGCFIFSYNTERAKFARYPMAVGKPDGRRRIATLGYYFYKLRDQPLEWDGSRLYSPHQKVGAHLGFSIVRDLGKLNIEVSELKTSEQLFGMLKERRLLAVAIQDTMADAFIYAHHIQNVEKVLPAIKTKDYFLAFNHKFAQENPELVHRIWEAIAAVRDKILSRAKGRYFR